MIELPLPPPAPSLTREAQSDELALMVLLCCPMTLLLLLKLDQILQSITVVNPPVTQIAEIQKITN